MSVRLTYVLRVCPEAGVTDPIKALKVWLKAGLRRHGLRCVSAVEEIEVEAQTENGKTTGDAT